MAALPSREYVDLINKKWSVEEFNTCQFSLDGSATETDDKTTKVVVRRFPTLDTTSSGIIGQSVSGITSAASGELLQTISNAFDSIVKQKLNEIDSLNLNSTNLSTTEKIKVLTTYINQLDNLKYNLVNHNECIVTYNNTGYFVGLTSYMPTFFGSSLGYCSDHTEMIKLIDIQRKKISDLEEELENTCIVEITSKISEIERQISNGLKIDSHFLWNIYGGHDGIEKSLLKIKNPSVVEPIRERFNGIVNLALLNDAKKSINMKMSIGIGYLLKNLENSMFINELYSNLITHENIKDITAFIEKLQNEKDLAKISPLNLKAEINSHINNLIIKNLNIPEIKKTRLNKFINLVQNLQIRYEAQCQLYLKSDIMTEMLNEIMKDTKNKTEILNKLKNISFSSYFDQILNESIGTWNINELLDDPKEIEFDTFLKDLRLEMNRKINSNKMTSQVVTKTSQFITHESLDWQERNRNHLGFVFQQGIEGENYVLNGGVCAAINYRWIKELLKNPTREIRKLEDLDPTVSVSSSSSQLFEEIRKDKIDNNPIVKAKQLAERRKVKESGISESEFNESSAFAAHEELDRINQSATARRGDRFLQGFYKMEGRNTGSYLVIPISITSKDGIESRHFNPRQEISSVSSLFGHVQNDSESEKPLLSDSSGILAINIYKKTVSDTNIPIYEAGHAIGLQVDKIHNIYRFWDPNSGLYTYDSIEELKEAMNSYMIEFYGNIYNDFDLVQYIPNKK